MATFTIGDADFLLDGAPFRILSGAIHYFRVHPDHWADRIRKARLMGLNTIETYVPWNQHARSPGSWTTDGILDLDRFLGAIADEGMYAIVRPGPYICAEFDNGGLPPWLFTDSEVGIRRNEPRFMAAVSDYLRRVCGIVAPRQIGHGGPVILMQVENEYGAYGSDDTYLRALRDIFVDNAITVPLTTVDQPEPAMLENGSIPGLHTTASFGSRSAERLSILRRHQPTGPLMCSEYWDGWFDSWGEHHHTTSATDAAADLDDLLKTGASVNLYMFHGGTNFGLTSGANDKGTYAPITTSYDYDAPLDEAGTPTDKYWAFRDVLERYTTLPDERPAPPRPAAVFETALVPGTRLIDAIVHHLPAIDADEPCTFADLEQADGFVLHTTAIVSTQTAVLTVGEIRDRVQVFVDGRPVGTLSREHHERAMTLPPVAETLTLLVENQGRVDYGPRIGEDKGIVGPVRLDGVAVRRWRSHGVPGSALPALWRRRPSARSQADPVQPAGRGLGGPVFAHGVFVLDDVQDLFLDTRRWGKGIAWINDWCLGRFWSRGPQETMYVPAPVLRRGENRVTVLEAAASSEATARFVAAARLGPTDG